MEGGVGGQTPVDLIERWRAVFSGIAFFRSAGSVVRLAPHVSTELQQCPPASPAGTVQVKFALGGDVGRRNFQSDGPRSLR